jgi:hypothetical protein
VQFITLDKLITSGGKSNPTLFLFIGVVMNSGVAGSCTSVVQITQGCVKSSNPIPITRHASAQSAQQTLKSIGESIKSYNSLVDAYYQGKVNRPSLPKYRKKGGLAAVTFPRQALTYKDGCFRPSISQESKPELITQIELPLPEFIDSDWVKEITVRPCRREFWIDWVIDDGKEPVKVNPSLDYSQAWGFDHGGTNWLTGVSTQGKSLIIDGRCPQVNESGVLPLGCQVQTG